MAALNTAIHNRKTIKKRGRYRTVSNFKEAASQTYKYNDIVGVDANGNVIIQAAANNAVSNTVTTQPLGFAVNSATNTTANTTVTVVDAFIDQSEFAVPVTNANSNAVTAVAQLNGTCLSLYNHGTYSWLVNVTDTTANTVMFTPTEIHSGEPVGTVNGYLWGRVPQSVRFIK